MLLILNAINSTSSPYFYLLSLCFTISLLLCYFLYFVFTFHSFSVFFPSLFVLFTSRHPLKTNFIPLYTLFSIRILLQPGFFTSHINSLAYTHPSSTVFFFFWPVRCFSLPFESLMILLCLSLVCHPLLSDFDAFTLILSIHVLSPATIRTRKAIKQLVGKQQRIIK